MKNMNKIMENIITRILMIPPSIPKEVFYIGMDQIDMESSINNKRMNYVKRVVNQKHILFVKLPRVPIKVVEKKPPIKYLMT